MPSQFTKSISLGSTPEREKAYLEAAKKRTNGNLSKMICSIVDKDLGLNLPLPVERRKRAMKAAALLCCILSIGLTACKKEPGETRTQLLPMTRNGIVTLYSGAITSDNQTIVVNADLVHHGSTEKIDLSLCQGAVCAVPPGVMWSAGVNQVTIIGAMSQGFTSYSIATTSYPTFS